MTAPVDDRRGVSRRIVALVLVGTVVVLLAALAWVGVRALLVKDQLGALVPVATELQEAAAAQDLARVDAAFETLSAHAAQASALSGDPLWRFTEIIPVLGPNLAAARVISSELDAIAEASGPLLAALEDAAPADGGTLDVATLEELAPSVQNTSDALTGAAAALGDIDPEPLIGELAGGVARLSEATSEAAPVAAFLASAAGVLPPILGSTEERHILIMLQNSAEVRTGGGITGSFILLRADAGEIELVDQADGGEFPGRVDPIAEVPASTTALYGDRVARFVQNTSMPSEFAVTAELVQAWWATHSDVVPDAVLSVDLPAIRGLLTATGPVPLGDGSEISAENVVQRVLVDPYLSLDVEQQTVYQRELTRALMAGLLSKQVDVLAWAEALAEPVDEGRLSLWSADPDEQGLIEDGPLAGQAARHRAAGSDTFAIYLNDATSGKMGPFLDIAFTAGTTQCREDGKREAAITVTLANRAPADAGEVFPWWLTGGGLEGVTPGHIATLVTVAAPDGSFFGGVRADGAIVPSTDVEDEGFPSSAAEITVAPGQTSSLEFRFIMPDDRDFTPAVIHTPLVETPELSAAPAACG